MSLDPQSSSESLGSLQNCLVGGDLDQRRRERKVRRRALVISVALQTTVLALVVLIPLFAKQPLLVTPTAPIPIYTVAANSSHQAPTTHANNRRPCVICFNSRPANIYPGERVPPTQVSEPDGIFDGAQTAPCPGCISIGKTEGPRPPVADERQPHKPRILYEPHIDLAMLLRRVEPIYPLLAKQARRGGRVELRAIIATDGSIRSLQVVSGDPLFYQSAREAVIQWHYRPTVLNGQPVEVDTFITVIYNFNP